MSFHPTKVLDNARVVFGLDDQPLLILVTKDGKPMPDDLDYETVLRGEGPSNVVVKWRHSPLEKRLSELLTDVGAVDCKVDLLLSKHEDLQDRADAIRAARKRDR